MQWFLIEWILVAFKFIGLYLGTGANIILSIYNIKEVKGTMQICGLYLPFRYLAWTTILSVMFSQIVPRSLNTIIFLFINYFSL